MSTNNRETTRVSKSMWESTIIATQYIRMQVTYKKNWDKTKNIKYDGTSKKKPYKREREKAVGSPQVSSLICHLRTESKSWRYSTTARKKVHVEGRIMTVKIRKISLAKSGLRSLAWRRDHYPRPPSVYYSNLHHRDHREYEWPVE